MVVVVVGALARPGGGRTGSRVGREDHADGEGDTEEGDAEEGYGSRPPRERGGSAGPSRSRRGGEAGNKRSLRSRHQSLTDARPPARRQTPPPPVRRRRRRRRHRRHGRSARR